MDTQQTPATPTDADERLEWTAPAVADIDLAGHTEGGLTNGPETTTMRS